MKKWSQLSEETHQEIRTTHARCAMDWLFPWMTRYWKDSEWWLKPKGSSRGVDWHIHSEAQTQDSEPEHDPVIDEEQACGKPTWINRWLNISGWQYPNPDASHHPAKATVTMLRKKHQIEIHETESASWFDERSIKGKVSEKPIPDGLSPGEKGTIHHHFLQWLNLDNDMTMDLLAEQRDQMIDSGHLDPRANDALNLSSIAAFWHSDIGQSIRTHREQLHRELPFTARFELSELKALGLAHQIEKEEAHEFVIIQGIVDVAILRNESIQILDYKTDQIEPQGLSGKLDQYRPQIELYAQALQRIYQRPVTHKWLHFLAVNQTIEMT
jgi:ATP-dependent helicase/nuclease subunit A